MKDDSRWKQRFDNYQDAFAQLKQAVLQTDYSDLERAGLIQMFEFSFELGWKLLKDYLDYQGFDVKSPKETIKQAFQCEYIVDGKIWIEALEDRNRTVHTYNKDLSEKMTDDIKNKYFPVLAELFSFFEEKSR